MRRHHPYEVPEIIALSVKQVLPAYRQWVLQETKVKR
ncbi:MAG: divalent cation tolerance protein CutA [Candidatus Omnitrophica bacterium]|nr:divalent cation tolerance protein CutA [Candidatus Omnitrophota bacterium]